MKKASHGNGEKQFPINDKLRFFQEKILIQFRGLLSGNIFMRVLERRLFGFPKQNLKKPILKQPKL